MASSISSIVQYSSSSLNVLNTYILKGEYSKIFVLVDENTNEYCLPLVQESLPYSLSIIKISSGETNKNLNTLQKIWEALTDKMADRKSLLINLGGGIITDMGGFAAATFKRGMRFINIPTTLLGMVDASVGGKTGIDFMGLKNQIGMFQNPELILIYDGFLKSLPLREFKSGMAEIIKYGLIDSNRIWKMFNEQEKDFNTISIDLIRESIQIKERVVSLDPKENGLRKTLNFGHTLGHAIETHFLNKPIKKQLLHGEAVAIGMILAAHLSFQTKGLAKEDLQNISQSIKRYYGKALPEKIDQEDYPAILTLLKHDKKNVKGQTFFILIQAFGKTSVDCLVTSNEIVRALDYYASID